MRSYKVGITGHRPERFRNSDLARSICRDTVLTIANQYDNVDLQFNIGGCVGADQWVGEACIEFGIKFNLFLPCQAEILSQHWYDNQKQSLMKQVESCESVFVLDLSNQLPDDGDFEAIASTIVEDSSFLICFWEGCLQGGTFSTVKKAVEGSKIVLNALDGLSLVSKDQLISRTKWGF